MRGGQNKLSKEEQALRDRPGRRSVPEPTEAADPPPAHVGRPPKTFTAAQKRSWAELAPAVAHSYRPSDRPAFCLAVKLHTMIEEPTRGLAPYVLAGLMRQLTGLLEGFGCTPRSRRLVDSSPGPVKPYDEDEEFFFGRPPPKQMIRTGKAGPAVFASADSGKPLRH